MALVKLLRSRAIFNSAGFRGVAVGTIGGGFTFFGVSDVWVVLCSDFEFGSVSDSSSINMVAEI